MSEGRDMGITGDIYIAPSMGDMCVRCNKRKSTVRWAEDGTAAMHGWVIYICDYCATKAQLEHAKEMALKVPELEAKLKELEDSDENNSVNP